MKDYLIFGGILAMGWLLISTRMIRDEARRRQRVRFTKGLMSLGIAGACVWFAWWVLATRCNGGC